MAKTNLPAFLDEHRDDELLTRDQLAAISVFREVKSERFAEFLGAIRLRHYRKGQPIVVQGDPGWTAFYILKTQDLLELRTSQLAVAKTESEQSHIESQIQEILARKSKLGDANSDEAAKLLAVATVRFETPAAKPKERRGFWLFRNLLGNSERHSPGTSKVIFADSNAVLTPQKQADCLNEGEVFGEMSCLYRTPRSATVTANCDWYCLEFLRNVFDKLINVRDFKKQMDAIYRERVLGFHLRNHEILGEFFRSEPSLVETLKTEAKILTFKPGEILVDQHERSDSMFVIRRGFVKVLANASSLYEPACVIDLPGLCRTPISENNDPGNTLQTRLGSYFSTTASADTVAAIAKGRQPSPEERDIVCDELNTCLSSGQGPWSWLCGAILEHANDEETTSDDFTVQLLQSFGRQLQSAARGSPMDVSVINDVATRLDEAIADSGPRFGLQRGLRMDPYTLDAFSTQQRTRYLNRLVLDAAFARILSPLAWEGPPRVVVYRQQGETIGEMGMLFDERRNATCIAYDHPTGKFGDVEVIRIEESLFRRLTESQVVSEKLHDIAEKRRDTDSRFSKRFDELGLVQGNQLMLIDLDRCTRCDECVTACVNTHRKSSRDIPGPTSRLFLDGPRIGRFLVPATCRQCTDPVCLIGCPVGSIRKGDSGEVVIENWCIGCTRCAQQCPYDAIQMHSLGLIPRGGGPWHYFPRKEIQNKNRLHWYDSRFPAKQWRSGNAPFRFDWVFSSTVSPNVISSDEICFRHEFSVDKAQISDRSYLLQIEAAAGEARVWLNGEPLQLESHPQVDKGKTFSDRGIKWHQQTIVLANTTAGSPGIRPGRNLIAIAVKPTASPDEVMMDCGLFDRQELSEEWREYLALEEESVPELVMRRAVVCDMCGSETPACVQACPHDAAWRGIARLPNSPLEAIHRRQET